MMAVISFAIEALLKNWASSRLINWFDAKHAVKVHPSIDKSFDVKKEKDHEPKLKSTWKEKNPLPGRQRLHLFLVPPVFIILRLVNIMQL